MVKSPFCRNTGEGFPSENITAHIEGFDPFPVCFSADMKGCDCIYVTLGQAAAGVE